MLESVCDFLNSWAVGCESCPFCVFGFFPPVVLILWFFFCVVSVGLDFVRVFAGSYYFARLVVLLSSMFVSCSVLMEVSAFW